MNKEDKLIYEFLDSLIKSSTEPGEIQICPVCKGVFHIWFGGYKRGEERLFGVTVRCESCDIDIAIDYGMSPPSWVEMD